MGMKDAWMAAALRVGQIGNDAKLAAKIAEGMPAKADMMTQLAHSVQVTQQRGTRRMLGYGGGALGLGMLSSMNGRSSGVQGIAPRSSGGYA